jgi:hypothetical protein
MSCVTYPRVSPVRPQAGVTVHRILARFADRARPVMPHLKAAGSILLFTAFMAALIGVKAAFSHARLVGFLKRMHTMSLGVKRSAASQCLLVGKDRQGRWVVRNEAGTAGGLFIDRAAALHFAMLEIGNRPQAVIMVPGTLELAV